MAAVATIGVHGFTAAAFLEALDAAGVRLLLDVRQRRGVRGSQYAWANSLRLQRALAEARIAYRARRVDRPLAPLRSTAVVVSDRSAKPVAVDA